MSDNPYTSMLLAGGLDAAPQLLVLFAIAVGLILLQAVAKPPARRGRAKSRRHALYLSRARKLLKEIRAIGPRQNPARVFGLLRNANPCVFEELLLCELERRGLKIYRSGKYSGDGGLDGSFDLDGVRWLVQAKRYRGFVQPSQVADLHQTVLEHGAASRRHTYGLFVHTGKTSPHARMFERESDLVQIISGERLLAFLAGERMTLDPRGCARQRSSRVDEPATAA